MLVDIYPVRVEYVRISKKGFEHRYYREHLVALLQCDCCGRSFERRTSQIDPRRLTKNHIHVCPKCPAKKFAQNKAVESRHFWNTTVDHDIDIDSI